MPTQPGSHSREDSLPSVPDSDFGGSISRNRRSFAALAQKTSNALASLSGTTTLRSSISYGSLSRPHKLSTPVTPPFDNTYVQLTGTSRPSSPALVDNPSYSLLKRRLTLQRIPTSSHGTRPSPPGPSKMHQTSSRLLRMTEDERPFTKVGSWYSEPRTNRKMEQLG
jgi:hypothetical protein